MDDSHSIDLRAYRHVLCILYACAWGNLASTVKPLMVQISINKIPSIHEHQTLNRITSNQLLYILASLSEFLNNPNKFSENGGIQINEGALYMGLYTQAYDLNRYILIDHSGVQCKNDIILHSTHALDSYAFESSPKSISPF